MNDMELRALVERMVAELAGQAPTPQVKSADYRPMEGEAHTRGTTEGGEGLPDITAIDLRELFGLTAIPPFQAWLEKMGFVENGRLTELAGDASVLLE